MYSRSPNQEGSAESDGTASPGSFGAESPYSFGRRLTRTDTPTNPAPRTARAVHSSKAVTASVVWADVRAPASLNSRALASRTNPPHPAGPSLGFTGIGSDDASCPSPVGENAGLDVSASSQPVPEEASSQLSKISCDQHPSVRAVSQSPVAGPAATAAAAPPRMRAINKRVIVREQKAIINGGHPTERSGSKTASPAIQTDTSGLWL